MNTKTLSVATLLATAAASATSASAMTVQIRDLAGSGETSLGATPGVYLAGTGGRYNGMVAGQSGDLPAGTYELEIDQLAGDGWELFLTYCIEPEQLLDVPPPVGTSYETAQLIDNGFTATEVVYAQRLWAGAFALSQTSNVNAAAFQAVLWELSEDDDQDLSAGNHKINGMANTFTNDVLNTAQAWLDAIVSGDWFEEEALVALVSDESQDLLIPADDLVPAPGALALAGVAGLVATRRRRA